MKHDIKKQNQCKDITSKNLVAQYHVLLYTWKTKIQIPPLILATIELPKSIKHGYIFMERERERESTDAMEEDC